MIKGIADEVVANYILERCRHKANKNWGSLQSGQIVERGTGRNQSLRHLLVDDDLDILGLNPLSNALNTGSAKVTNFCISNVRGLHIGTRVGERRTSPIRVVSGYDAMPRVPDASFHLSTVQVACKHGV